MINSRSHRGSWARPALRAAAMIGSALLTMSVTGCRHREWGVGRVGTAERMPPIDQIAELLRSTPGVRTVTVEATADGRRITRRGLKPVDTTYSFVYNQGHEVWGVLQITKAPDGSIQYNQHMRQRDRPPSQQTVDSVVALMRAIEVRLQPLALIPESVTERCYNVRC